MGHADKYVHGTNNVTCDRCGFKFKATEVRKTWDGLYVCKLDWEPRHPQDFLRAKEDDRSVDISRPEGADSFISVITSENLAAHYDASDTSSITVATGVSQWNDLSGNARHLLQATAASQPTYSLANKSVTFDGTDDYMKAVAFTLGQPTTYYIVMNQVSWTNQDFMFDGDTGDSVVLYQNSVTPNLAIYAGVGFSEYAGLDVGADGVACAVFNGASSSIKTDNLAPLNGDAGTADAGGLTLGSRADEITRFGNIIVYELAIYTVAHNSAQQTSIITELQRKWGIT